MVAATDSQYLVIKHSIIPLKISTASSNVASYPYNKYDVITRSISTRALPYNQADRVFAPSYDSTTTKSCPKALFPPFCEGADGHTIQLSMQRNATYRNILHPVEGHVFFCCSTTSDEAAFLDMDATVDYRSVDFRSTYSQPKRPCIFTACRDTQRNPQK